MTLIPALFPLLMLAVVGILVARLLMVDAARRGRRRADGGIDGAYYDGGTGSAQPGDSGHGCSTGDSGGACDSGGGGDGGGSGGGGGDG